MTNPPQISPQPPKTDLSHALTPDLEMLSADTDHLCPFTTRRLLNIIDVFSHVHFTTLSSIALGQSIPEAWSEEELYSLDIIAALTCRLLAHPMHALVDIQPFIEHYMIVVQKRIPTVVFMTNHLIRKALWKKPELGIVEGKAEPTRLRCLKWKTGGVASVSNCGDSRCVR